MSSEAPLPAGFERRGFLVVVSGPSGVGKTALCAHLLETRTDTVRSVSATTRAARPGEVDGRDYTFLDRAEFEARLAAGEFLEHATVHGQHYGTPRRFVENAVERGNVVLLNIDVQGGLQVRRSHPDGVFVFVYPPSLESLRARLRARQQDGDVEIERRLAGAPEEMAHYTDYDYVVVNEDLRLALAQVSAIVEAERARATRLVPIRSASAAKHGA
jgi:guanylate kinase